MAVGTWRRWIRARRGEVIEKLIQVGDEYWVRGKRCLPVRLKQSFADREAMARHYIGRTVDTNGNGFVVIGVESFARGGEFRAGETIGLMVKS